MPRLFAWETQLPEPDLAACAALKLAPGRFAVEMAQLEESRGGLFLPDRERKWRRPALGVILAMGPLPRRRIPTEGKKRRDWPQAKDLLAPGDCVFVRPEDGKRIQGFGIGGYKAEGEVRLLGVSSPWLGSALAVPWDESILGAWDPMTRTARAVGRRLLLKLPEKPDQTGAGLYLPDWMQSRTDVAEVVSVGAQVIDPYQPGDLVTFNRRALHEIHSEDGAVYAFILEDGVFGRVEEPAAA